MSSQPVLKFMLATKGAINIAFGVGLLAVPTPLLQLYELLVDSASALLARLLGAAFFGIGLVQFFGRSSSSSDLQSLLVGAFAIADLIGFALSVVAMHAGLMNVLGWGVASIYAFAGFGFTLAWLKECRASLGPNGEPKAMGQSR